MNDSQQTSLWQDRAHAYAVVAEGADVLRGTMSHTEAMILAEELRHVLKVAVVVHVVGGKCYEVDRYPLR